MQTMTEAAPISGKAQWAGYVLSGLVILFLLFDGVIKLVPIAVVTETLGQLGYPPELARGLGVLTLVCAILYAIPRTSVWGAILLTGLFGGAIATHLRVGSPVFSHLLFGAISVSSCGPGSICAMGGCGRSFRSDASRHIGRES
jgi:DoxX-like family